jgi:hypothetical protein
MRLKRYIHSSPMNEISRLVVNHNSLVFRRTASSISTGATKCACVRNCSLEHSRITALFVVLAKCVLIKLPNSRIVYDLEIFMEA